ncbi:unnamed protein product [Ilex paraguariensis]|uniref:Myb/SANT-like DNA-binding domain-containing protein n=1 Tax=Ilex paraguariensis TaxID=185542 RepID=A0ABC8SU45_9AQUA
MDGSSAGNNLMPSQSGGFSELQGSMQVNHQQNPPPSQSLSVHPEKVQDVFPFSVGILGNTQDLNQSYSPFDSNNKGKRAMNFASNDERSNVLEEGVDGHTESGGEKSESLRQRLRWTDIMVKLLITAISYIEEDATPTCNGGRVQKKGKWKAISKVLVERGYHVSPRQCEDKYNDLNKKYKRLNAILGKDTSCRVVENPALLDSMDLCEQAKGNVRKILSSKQLFYQQMCSYHNGNRLFLPYDWTLQQSLQLALKRKDGYDRHRVSPGVSLNRNKQTEQREDVGFGNGLNVLNGSRRSDVHPPINSTSVNHDSTKGGEREQSQNQWMESRSLRLKEQRLQIQAQMLELEQQRLKWLRSSLQEDMRLDKMMHENELMKLENERLASELRRREMDPDYR